MTSTQHSTPVALVTGASQGLGLALTRELVARGWRVVVDARDGTRLEEAVQGFDGVTAVVGDVSDPTHRTSLATTVESEGRLDLLVNNASTLGPSPMPRLADYPADVLTHVFAVNVVAPLALVQLVLPALRRAAGRVVNISSDAGVEAYEGWGGYGSAKAALDHASAVLAVENPGVRVYAVDPGDMRTAMHQAAFPGEDISDRQDPADVVPALLAVLTSDLPSGRYRAADLVPVAAR